MARKRVQQQREARWRRLSGEWEASGLTQREFCEQREVSLASFSWWRCELARRDRQRAAALRPDQSTVRERGSTRLAAEQTAPEAASSAVAVCRRKKTKPGRPGNQVRREEAHVSRALPRQGTQTENPFIPVQLIGPAFSTDPRLPLTDPSACLSARSAQAGRAQPQDRAALEVLLASGHRIRIHEDFDASLLQKLIAVLEAPLC